MGEGRSGRWVVRILGLLVVSRDGVTVDLAGPRRRALVCRLAVAGGHPVPAAQLAEDLWEGRPGPGTPATLQSHVSHLRRLLGPDRLVYRDGGYALELSTGEIDAVVFDRETTAGLRQLAAGDVAGASGLLESALGRWHGPALADVAGQLWAVAEIARLDQLRLHATEALLDARLALGEHEQVVAGAEAAVARQPLRERLWYQLMLALYRSGRQADALASYQRLRQHLDDELGLAPSPGVTALQAAILRHDPELDAPARAAAPVRATPVPRELPADVNGFTGRQTEQVELDWLLPAAAEMGEGEAPRPVAISVLTGTAGVGKTALAVRWAHRVADSFPDGQLYVNLRGYDPDQPVLATEALAGFLRALGVAGTDIPLEESERAGRYRSLLAGKRMLVVLDNAATAEHVRPLLPGAPSVMVLVTSRDALAGLVARDGAHRVELDVLPAPDAAALLCTLIGPRAEVDPAATAALARQCVQLPLALRVAAELALTRPDTPLTGLVDELAGQQDRLELLGAGGDPRAAVASVFSWSYRHLPPGAARMFRLLALHPGGDWDLYAAAALAGTTLADAGHQLDTLARAHLIQSAGAGRYSLHDLLRAYGAGLAAGHDDGQARRAALTRLFDYYLAACAAAMDLLTPTEQHRRPDAERRRTPLPNLSDRAAGVAWLDGELANLTDVAAHSAAHGWPGHTTRLAGTLQRYLYGGHHAEGLTIQTHALTAARDRGDRAAQASTLTSLGVHHYNQGRYEQAAECHQQALALALAVGDRLTQARALGNLAALHHSHGRNQEAADSLRQIVVLFRELGDRHAEARASVDLGNSYLQLSRHKLAVSHLERALAESREIGARHIEAYALNCLGDVYYHQGRHQQAAEHQWQALAVSREIGYRTLEALALVSLGHLCHRQGRDDQAAEHHQRALALYRQMGHRVGEAEALNGAGEALLATGQLGQAQDCLTTALDIARKVGNRSAQAAALTRLAEVRCRQGHLDQAGRDGQQAIALYQEIGARDGQADALNSAGETFLAAGQPGQARDSCAAALTLARQIGDRYQQARAHRGLASAAHATGDLSRAGQHWRRARDLYTDMGLAIPDRIPADQPRSGQAR